MDRFFSMDNKFFTFMGKVADLFILNILCLICCIPIVTAGASITAMFYVTMKMVKNEEAYIIKSFFKSFKQNFKQATVINLIMLVLAVILYVDMSIVKQMGQPLGQIMNIIFLAFSVLYVMVFLYIYPVLAKFYNSTRNTFINAVLMSVRHLPYTVLMAAVCACPIILVSFAPTFRMQATIALICLVIGGAVVAYCNSFFLDKIFQNYIPEDAENPDGGKAE
ncbi:MAG: YesL family protein [Blautia sp.]|uniref:YesL family protein n=1 Tax=Blautia obeum TaxID=40520 RepID=UPI00157157C4|nr:DUF624 domain-containing protein [Blautia obeum]MBN2947221.1 YesL family protein [Blautia sp.]NSG39142.1 YesL family protein [Blautia obeum]